MHADQRDVVLCAVCSLVPLGGQGAVAIVRMPCRSGSSAHADDPFWRRACDRADAGRQCRQRYLLRRPSNLPPVSCFIAPLTFYRVCREPQRRISDEHGCIFCGDPEHSLLRDWSSHRYVAHCSAPSASRLTLWLKG